MRFRFENGSRGRHDLPEIMGGGVALIDGENDGDLDLFFCNGGPIGDASKGDGRCRYYRNDGGTFVDATARARTFGPPYAMGAAVGDFDGDGRDDLFVSGWRGQRLYRNLGGGVFEDVTRRAGLVSNLWSTSAAWADLDGDGDLDLYVCGYLTYEPDSAPFCAAPDGRRDYCGPESFPAEPDRLYRNNGDGTFIDVAHEAGVDLPEDRGLGVLVADLIGDYRPDVFVANDGTACRLFENLGGMRFRDVAAEAGVALDGRGEALAGMGVALGDLDGDGRSDLVVSNFHGRGSVVFRALGAGRYIDASGSFGLTAPTRGVLGFGLALADLSGSGRFDLIQANGHVLDRARLGVPFAMRPTLLAFDRGRFVDAAPAAGPCFERPTLGRGLAVGDLDGDNHPDVVVNHLDAPAAVLHNESPGRWAVVEVIGRGRRTPFGARLRANVGGRTAVRDLPGGGSYLSSSSQRLYLGLRPGERLEGFEVSWPWGGVESWPGPFETREGPIRAVAGEGRLIKPARP